MNPRPRAIPGGGLAHRRPTAVRHQAPSDQWNQQMTRVLREAAEVREERERARSSEDELLAQRETAALMDLIQGRGRPRTSEHISRPAAGGSPGPADVTS